MKTARGDRLMSTRIDEIFSGDIWLGAEAHALGLLDGIGDVRSEMRARFGDDVELRHIDRLGFLEKVLGETEMSGHKGIVGSVTEGILDVLEDRIASAHYRLR